MPGVGSLKCIVIFWGVYAIVSSYVSCILLRILFWGRRACSRVGALIRHFGGVWPFSGSACVCVRACGLYLKSRVGHGLAPRFLRFIRLVSFSDTLLVVSFEAAFAVLKG